MIKAIKKALQSICRHKIAAVAFDKNNNIVAIANNRPRFMRKGGGLHAEMVLIRRYGAVIKGLLILRVNKSGKLLPIDPCVTCAAVMKKLGIRTIRIR